MRMYFNLEELAAALTGGDVCALRTLLRDAGVALPDAAAAAVPRAAVIELMVRHAGSAVARGAAEVLRER